MIEFRKPLIAICSFALVSVAMASEDYCSSEGVRVAAFYLVNANDRNADFRSQAESLREISDSLNIGDLLELYLVGRGGDMTKSFNACKPGCPDAGALGEIFGSTCQKTRAKRDLKVFEQKLVRPLASYFRGGQAPVEPADSMYRPLASISQHIEQNSNSPSLVYIVGSLNTALTTDKEYSTEFVKLVQGTPPALPSVDGFKAVSFNAETISFWNDLFLASGKQLNLE